MMNAHEFVAKHGVDEVRELIEQYEHDQFAFKLFDHGADCCFDAGLYAGAEKAWWDICIYDLKHIIESVEKITALGGIGLAKLIDQSTYGENLDLYRAIADYKLVQAHKNGEA